jgi:hypothetical protein
MPNGLTRGATLFLSARTLDELDADSEHTGMRMCGEVEVPAGKAVETLGDVQLCIRDGALSVLHPEFPCFGVDDP